MKKFRGMISIILVLTMLCSVFSLMGTVSATTVNETTVETNLPENVQDGLILHAFCWGYSEIEESLASIAAAGYTAIQTSPVQQPKDISASTDISGQWWKLYQPVSLSFAGNTWLGTKEELTSLCTAAEKYGIKIICDVVSNHLGASEKDSYYVFDDEVAVYEPTIWNGTEGNVKGVTENNPYCHQPSLGIASDANAKTVTQGVSSLCPDLNTGHDYIQEKVSSLLKECIDCGVDGFRFDAAKHIETPDDPDVNGEKIASDYWTTVLGNARDYAESKGQELYCYGEVLNTPGEGRSYSSYTNLGLSITDNLASAAVRKGVTGKSASGAASNAYNVGLAKNALLWAESHDTYLNDEGDNTSNVSNEDIVKTWAMVASRKDATALFFPRTDSMSMGGKAVDTTYKSIAVTEINNFHNECVGEDETLGSSENFAYVVRGQKGIVIVNTNGTTAQASIAETSLADGEYTDMITGNKFTVTAGTVSGTVGSTGVAVVTKGTTTPRVLIDKESQAFDGNTITLNLTLLNATSGTYQLDNYEVFDFTESTTIRIGKGYDAGETMNLTLTATDGTKTTTTTYKYTKKQTATSGVYVMVPDEVVEKARWTAPLYCYVYDEITDASSSVEYRNAAWPGERMKHDDKLNCYYIQIPNTSCIKAVVDGDTTLSSEPDTFDLANSVNTRVIFSDSSAQNGQTSSGKQFPTEAMTNVKLAPNGKSHQMNDLSSRVTWASNWVETNLIPSDRNTEDATEIGKNGIIIPTVGNVNDDDVIDINDATDIQKFIADLGDLYCGIKVADADGNGRVNIMDATYIQRYAVKMSNFGKVGEIIEGDTGDIPGQPTPTIPEDTKPQGETYTAYVKTTITWMEDSSCGVFLYDKSTGESYYMARDTEAYPYVYKAEIPVTCTDVITYRALGVIDDPQSDSSAYNLHYATLSKTNNCNYWISDTEGYVCPYVEEQPPTFSLQRLYVDNSEAKWSQIYVYGWGEGLVNTKALAMTHLTGDIWYIDLPQAISDGVTTFLFKNTETGWEKQSADVTITSPHNCYKLSKSSGDSAHGNWYTYNN